jgi:hypothetical protein
MIVYHIISFHYISFVIVIYIISSAYWDEDEHNPTLLYDVFKELNFGCTPQGLVFVESKLSFNQHFESNLIFRVAWDESSVLSWNVPKLN